MVAAALLGGLSAMATGDSLVTSVYSEVSDGYERPRLPDGSFKREYYAIANGVYSPGRDKDRSIDGVKFPAIAGMVAQYLAGRNYYFAPDSKSADLLLVISWGTTIPFRDGPYRNTMTRVFDAMNGYKVADAASRANPLSRTDNGIQSNEAAVAQATLEDLQGQLYTMQMFEAMRRDADVANARLLGYVREINYRDVPSRFAGAGMFYDELIEDIETPRYYLILAAYDFRAATQQKQRKLLWVTRVSIQAQGNRFNEKLKDMLANASRYFGRESGRLIRQYQEGSVSFGELKFLGFESKPTPPATPAQGH